MYFPYLRGRQFELIALRELLEENLIGEKVIPVVEPIKPTSTLASTLDLFMKNNHKIALVINPEVGEFVDKIREMEKTDKVAGKIYDSVKNQNLIRAYIMKDDIPSKLMKDNHKDKYMIINPNRDCLDNYLSLFGDVEPQFTLIPDDRAFIRRVANSKVIFEDRFVKAKKNADYVNDEDQFFSEDHLFYKNENMLGFSDYSIVGEEYMESGFAPTAVAIHIVYFDEKKVLRVHHFVSDSNMDINDPAGKFGEALQKLVDWAKQGNVPMTKGMKSFFDCYENGKYPGLGTVKKYSIMHHLELMNKYLEGELD